MGSCETHWIMSWAPVTQLLLGLETQVKPWVRYSLLLDHISVTDLAHDMVLWLHLPSAGPAVTLACSSGP